MSELQFGDTAAAGYDQMVGRMTREVIPTLLRVAHLSPGHRVLDIASGTGLAAEAAASVIGSAGHVTAADISPAMLDKARERLGMLPNVLFAVEDGRSLTFPDESFDRLICNMSLMYFPDPARGLAEFYRVLGVGGRAAVSVSTGPAGTLYSRVLFIMDRDIPGQRHRSGPAAFDGNEQTLRTMLEGAGFKQVKTATEIRRFAFPSFDDYFGGVERGGGNTGQEYAALPEDVRHAVREAVRRDVGDTGGPIELEVAVTFGSGRK